MSWGQLLRPLVLLKYTFETTLLLIYSIEEAVLQLQLFFHFLHCCSYLLQGKEVLAQIKRNVSKPESMKTSVKPPTPTSAKESFKPEHTNTTRKKCRFENRGKCKNGRSCQFYHPRRTCKFFSQSNTCQKGEKNVNSDIQGEYVQFKTSQSSEMCKTQST